MTLGYPIAFKLLNDKQREAVEAIDGPVLVIAGPGTGKTQLISTRVGYILQNADIEPANILLLTFTDAAVAEMRARLEQLIPTQTHKVNVYTYHGFANDLIRSNPEYFEGLENEPIDDLASMTVLSGIIDALPYSDPLKAASYYQKQLLSFIDDAKRALLSPKDIEAVAKANLQVIAAGNKACGTLLAKLERISPKAVPIFRELHHKLDGLSLPKLNLPPRIKLLLEDMSDSLFEALTENAESGSTKPLTAWKGEWLAKDDKARFILAGEKENQRLLAAAGIYQVYQAKLAEQRTYDYADMINRTIEVLETNPDFKYSQAEHYQYLMLDEFQDTNAAQLRLTQLLTDAPVYEGRPNVMAVGDDDQAIYAFQGADYANMAAFMSMYRDVKLITLNQNYRSHQAIIDTSANLSGQIESRLHHKFPEIEKKLQAAGASAKTAPQIGLREFISDAAELDWIASQIQRLIKAGTNAEDIAVLAPKHKYLEQLLPYLNRKKLPVAYEKREDVLEDPKIVMLTQLSRLVMALASGDDVTANALWPEILSYDFWRLPTDVIWQLVWDAKDDSKPLTPAVLAEPRTEPIGRFILQLADLSRIASLEEMLDAMIGIGDIYARLDLAMPSPFFEYHFSVKAIKSDPESFTNLLSNLNLLRVRLRARQHRQAKTTKLKDFVNYIDEHQSADINVLNTSPYHQSRSAVNLLTAYGAKGREFKAVFVMFAQSEVWGSASRSSRSAVKLPANLKHISYIGGSDDERLRLFYVAITRAKSHLYLTSHQQTLDGQRRKHLEFLELSVNEAGHSTSALVPPKYAKVTLDERGYIDPEAAIDYWTKRHLPSYPAKLQGLLASRLAEYKLNATHLTKFLDIEQAGPETFFIYYLLGFPQAPTETTAYGTAFHVTAAWTGNQLAKGKLPTQKAALAHFDEALSGGWLRADEHKRLRERGHKALPVWLKQVGPTLSAGHKYEKNFYSENVQLGPVRMSGKVDRIVLDKAKREITVIDIKTGKAYTKWAADAKLHRFQQQLMFYKLLVEGSNAYRSYTVNRGLIEFADPLDGNIASLELEMKDDEIAEFKKLIKAVWNKTQSLELPEIKSYPKSLKGIRAFEKDLIEGNK